jgi:hypothetical protein
MGRTVNLDQPLSSVDKQYLRSRGRGGLVITNERRFGVDGTRTPEAHEETGATTQSPFYDNAERDKAVYDIGGAALPGTTLDHDTGRAFDRDNGVTVEPVAAGYRSQASDPRKYVEEGFGSASDDDDDLDQDIVDYVLGLDDEAVVKVLAHYSLTPATDADRQANNEQLAIHLQETREAGTEIDLTYQPE